MFKRFFSLQLPRLTAMIAVLPAVASAHPGHDGGHDLTWDFGSGLAHPITGWDHVLAMVAVGVLAAQLRGRARLILPATFVAIMALGAAVSGHVATMSTMGIEQMIAASVLVFGLMILIAKRMPLSVGLGLTSVFAAFHGFAHGLEVPATASGFSYGLGFIVATVFLHAIGYALGSLKTERAGSCAKIAGTGMAIIGAAMLAVS